MREHQIVITLKPEQFIKVQRLARESGAKSMGLFVRQALLSALGIESAGTSTSSGAADALDLNAQIVELKRLHSELREFIAESMAEYNTDLLGRENFTLQPAAEPDAYFSASAPAADGDGQDISELPGSRSMVDDELEELADRTFAISPRLGPIFDHESPGPGPLRDPLGDLLEDVSLESSLAESAADDDDDSFTVPLSIRERRRQLAEEHTTGTSQNDRDSGPRRDDERGDKPGLPSSETGTDFRADRHSRQRIDHEVSPQPSSASDDSTSQPASSKPKSEASSAGLPPISGSPPPKRRRT